MDTANNPRVPAAGKSNALGARELLLLAAWSGLATGLLEGAAFLGFQTFGGLGWNVARLSMTPRILWVSPLADLAFFLLIGLLLILASLVMRLAREARFVGFLFALLAAFDWASLTGRIRLSGSFVLAAGLATVFARWFAPRKERVLIAFRRSLPWMVGGSLLLLVGVEGKSWMAERAALAQLPPAAAGSPNVLILLLDTVRADHISSLGYPRATTPNIDSLGQQGVLFENAYSASSWTLPSHASLLTGRFPHEHGAEKGRYDGRFRMLSEVLRERGYVTAAFSANINYFTRLNGFGPGFIRFEDVLWSFEDCLERTAYGRLIQQQILLRLVAEDTFTRKRASEVSAALLGWLDTKPKGRPFFAFLNYYDTHDPYEPPPKFPARFSKGEHLVSRLNENKGFFRPRNPQELKGEIDAYDDCIAYLDEQIGALIGELGRRGQASNTILIVTSDHGESLGEHNLFLHRNALWRELIHVPLMIIWPGHVPAGVRVSETVSNVSLPATVMDLMGSGEQKVFPGPSLAPLWETKAPVEEWPYPLAELAQMPFPGLENAPAFTGSMKTVVTPRWQLIQHEKQGTSLYDFQNDPKEERNLAATDEGKQVAAALLRCLQEDASHLSATKCGIPVEHKGD